jgi:Cu/Ag efflux protein CusF
VPRRDHATTTDRVTVAGAARTISRRIVVCWYVRCTDASAEECMKAIAILLTGLVAIVSSSAAASAADATTDPSATPRGATPAPSEDPGVLSVPHHLSGRVVSVDEMTKTLSVKDDRGKQFSFLATAGTAAHLKRLKVGDQITLTYKKHRGRLVVTEIERAQAF